MQEEICEECGLPVSSRIHKEGLNGIHGGLAVAGGSGDEDVSSATPSPPSPEPPTAAKPQRKRRSSTAP